VLNHITDAGGGSSTTRRHYNVNLYIAEKRQALEAWERSLIQIIDPPIVDEKYQTAA
jgi:hypothetical protein